uniref:Retrovirus-related Pol polyprotein from transposon TNT 1-94-like beta-barrel domain-containing protein n=1 Tax=Peronospora matthiolae TaxID=2874970 RepID=A0AAV1UIL7_9STRA
MEEMESAFSRSLTRAQVSEFCNRRKSISDTWPAHYLYLMAVRNATGVSASLVPESLVMHASPELRPAQTYEDNEKRAPRPVKAALAAATATARTETRVYNICSTVGHIARPCPSRPKIEDEEETPRWALASLVAGFLTEEDWIVDSGASTHLVKHSSMLYDWMECKDPTGVTMPDKSTLRVTRSGKARLRVKVDGETYWIELRNVNYAPKLSINLIFLGTLMLQGCCLADKNNKHAVMINDDVVIYVQIKQIVLVVDRGHVKQRASGLKDVVMYAIGESQPREATVQTGSLLSFHRRFGHLNYEDIE